VGRHLARRLAQEGHSAVLVARGLDRRDASLRSIPSVHFVSTPTDDVDALTEAFIGCDAVAHCAGINRELAGQTYQRVHVDGTRAVVEAARRAGVPKLALLSFLRARPNCGSGYHESKWAAEEIVRRSGLDWTVLKCGVIYGRGDHMLDHLSRAFHSFPVFALVGLRDRAVRPVAVEDVAGILETALVDSRLSGKTLPVTGPDMLSLSDAVRRVAAVAGRRPLFVRAPVFFHYALAWLLERLMTVPLVSLAQVRILSEGLTEAPFQLDPLPADLAPSTPFDARSIRPGLPEPGGFRMSDLRCCAE
jgi:NADH dehydrogenase